MSSIQDEKTAILEVFARYCFYTDLGRAEDYANLFTEDCDWDGGPFGRQQGRANLLAFIKQGAGATALRHHNTNIVIDVNGNEARAASYVTVYGVAEQTPVIFFVGCYIDHLVKRDGRWYFKQRKIRTDLSEATHL
jgi:hypothetical protein